MIARDGSYKSLWQQMPPYESTSKGDTSILYDVVIVGGGITGISTALQLQNAGKNCLLLEANNIGFGTTGGTTAHLNTLLDTPYTTLIKNFGEDKARLVRQAAEEALSLIRSNIETYQIDCEFEPADAFLFAQNEDQASELEKIFDACQNVQLETATCTEIPVPIPFNKAIQVSNQGKFHPIKYIYALAKRFEEAGGVILQNCRLYEHEEQNKILTLKTTDSLYKTKALVYATHIPPGINLLHLRCTPMRSYAMAVTLHDERYPDDLAYDMHDPYHYYRTHVFNGTKYLIAGGKDHKTAHHSNTQNCFLQLESHIRKYFNVKTIAHQWSSQYFESVDGLPYIGHLPGASPTVFVATGFGGNGMTYGSLSAILLSDLLVKNESRYKDLFSPSRVKPVAGFTGFINHNADVVKSLIGGWLSVKDMDQFASIAPGDGKVVKVEDSLVAISKDTAGNLYAVSPACTHMKCSVEWNNAEQSWDCPCHGARYSRTGRVITGPANKDLEVIELPTLTTLDVER
jgi:glycine/D-amino acid oxidase-like deaminating enzyme/nitrite reductase/ring-hydroxylating ferredoxin subunit